jgi:ABC-type branched-subunit amino acid transport system permease subunit
LPDPERQARAVYDQAAARLVGYPCFRLRITGHYFALLTLALSAIVLQIVIATHRRRLARLHAGTSSRRLRCSSLGRSTCVTAVL